MYFIFYANFYSQYFHRNPFRHILASASADQSVKIWDMQSPACVQTLTHHTDKVQTLKWHPIEEPILLTAAYDKTLAVIDVREAGSKAVSVTETH